MLEALGLDFPNVFLTLAKALGMLTVAFYLFDQIDEVEEFDD